MIHNSDQHSVHNATTCSLGSNNSVSPPSTIPAPKSPANEKGLFVKRRILVSDVELNQKRREKDSSKSPESAATRSTSSRRSHKKAVKSLFQSPHQEESSCSVSSKVVRSIKRITPNLRRATNPQASQSVFRLPSATITGNQKSNQDNPKQISEQSDHLSNRSDRKRSSTPRPTYAEEVLPYKQQRYNSPLQLPKHRVPSTSNEEDNDESDLESILTDLTESYSEADSNVSWSDVLLNLPVRAVGRKSKVRRRERSKHGDKKIDSVKSSGGSARSKRSFTVKFTANSSTQNKGRSIQ